MAPVRRPTGEVLEHGDDSRARAPVDRPFLAFVDWWLERPRRHRRGVFGVGLLLAATLVADVVAVVRHEPPARPTVPPEVIAERQRVAERVAKFVRSQHCAGSEPGSYRVVRHDPDWSLVRYEVRIPDGSDAAGTLVLDVEPSDVEIRYRVVAADGACHV